MKVQVKSSQCIGLKVREWVYDAEVVRVNKKSLRVKRERYHNEETFRFVKTLEDGRSLFRNSTKEYVLAKV